MVLISTKQQGRGLLVIKHNSTSSSPKMITSWFVQIDMANQSFIARSKRLVYLHKNYFPLKVTFWFCSRRRQHPSWTCPSPPACRSPRPGGGRREGQRPPRKGLMSKRDIEDIWGGTWAHCLALMLFLWFRGTDVIFGLGALDHSGYRVVADKGI